MSTTHYIALLVYGAAAPGGPAALAGQTTLRLTATGSLTTFPLVPVWPVTLPQDFLVDGYEETPGEAWIRTPMEVGAAKVRRRYTAMPRTVVGNLAVTKSQVATLRAFFVTTLDGGTQPFQAALDRIGVTQTFRFTAPPIFEPVVPDLWLAKLKLETVL